MDNQKGKKSVLDQPIIFLGNPRSGTSVISEIILRHRKLGFPSQYQTKFTNPNYNYLRRLMDNRFWRFVGQKNQLNRVGPLNSYIFRPVEGYSMWARITDADIDFSRGFLHDTVSTEVDAARIRSFFQDLVRKQGKSRLGFKITGPSRLKYLNSIFPDAKIVRIHRRLAPTVSSLLKVEFWKSIGMHQLWWKGAYSAEELKLADQIMDNPIGITAFQVNKITQVTDSEIEDLNLEVLNIHYEDFVAGPEVVISRILEFTGLDMDKTCFNYLRENKIFNRNKRDEELFSESDLSLIRDIENGRLTSSKR